jgi:enoyl-CoA hydratase/carnithine racemase
MPYTYLDYENEEGIAKITIKRPEVLNALSPALLEELIAAFENAGADDSVRVIILTGTGRAFSAGVDLAALGERRLEGGRVGPILDDPARRLIHLMQTVPKVVIAAVNGYCFTGALELVLGCDLIVVAVEAKLGDTHAKFGLRPSWGMSQRLPRLIGPLKAKELAFTGAFIAGDEAARLGLANMAVPAEDLENTVRELARKIMENSPEALAAAKYLCNEGMKGSLGEGLDLEARSEFQIGDTEDRVRQFRKR